MGKASRDKGKRVEYLVRDHLRSIGYESHRVPSSGAAQGFKGDVTFCKDLGGGLVEVKARKDSFKSLYAYLAKYAYPQALIMDASASQNVVMGLNFDEVLHYSGGFYATPQAKEFKAAIRKLRSCQKYIQGCNVLVLKDNNKPLIFIRYVGGPASGKDNLSLPR